MFKLQSVKNYGDLGQYDLATYAILHRNFHNFVQKYLRDFSKLQYFNWAPIFQAPRLDRIEPSKKKHF